MMMKQDNWMPFYVGDYLRDTGHLSACEHGAYLLLLMHAWTHDGALQNDEVRLRNIAKLSVKDWNRFSATLRAFFYVDGDTLRHRRIDRELAKSKARSEKRSAAGKASGVARKAQQKANTRSTHVDLVLQQSPTEEEEEEEEKKERIPPLVPPPAAELSPKTIRAKARTQIDPGWKPNDLGIAYAKERGVQPSEVRAFKDFHMAKGNAMADWDAAWRMWCRNAVKFGNATPLLNQRDDGISRMAGALG